jgi:ribonuclease BN (tRNA processing enzyme)
MKIEILGCCAGIGRGRATTAFLIEESILIDAGTGVGNLEPEQIARIRHIFITHAHLDHIASIPLLLVSTPGLVQAPIVIHGREETLRALHQHIFNSVIWPDFTAIPVPNEARVRFRPMTPGDVREVQGLRVELIPVDHVVPAAGYRVESVTGAFAFTGDTSTNDSFWKVLNARSKLDLLFVELAFAEADRELSLISKHYCPSLLGRDLEKLVHRPEIFISHLQSGREKIIMAECAAAIAPRQAKQLSIGTTFEI